MLKILLIEDDKLMAERTREWLALERYDVEVAHDGDTAKYRLADQSYDLIILDLQLPGISGLKICQDFRDRGGQTPVLMLTGQDTIKDKQSGFSAGADDYLTKPFAMEELSARVSALLRRPSRYLGQTVTMGAIVIETAKRQIIVNGQEIHLKPLEYDLLEYFIRHPGQIFSPEALLARVWPAQAEASLDSVYTCMNRLRKNLEKPGHKPIFVTVHGLGYRFDPPTD